MKHRVLLLTTLFGCLALSGAAPAGTTILPLSFGLLEKTVYSKDREPEFSQELRELEGRQVRIAGFMIPYDDPEKITKLLLVKNPGGCFFCNLPLPNGIVFVRLPASAPPVDYTVSQTGFEGTFHLWHAGMPEDDETKGFLYTIDNARVADSTSWDRLRTRVVKFMAALKRKIASAMAR